MDTDLRNFLIDHSLEGIVITDLEGSIIHCNATARRLLGYADLEPENQFVGCLFPDRSVSHLVPNLLHLARSDAGFEGEVFLQGLCGEDIMVRLFARAWPGRMPVRLILRFVDWRDTHRVIQRLRDTNHLTSLGTLTRSLSHEILNPVSIIGSSARRLIESGRTDPQGTEWARQMMSAVEKLEEIIQTLETFLDLPAPSFEKKRVQDIMEICLTLIREDADRLGIVIKRIGGSLPPPVFMDPGLMERALSAVLFNAVDRMPRGGEITASVRQEDRHCIVQVDDSGPSLDLHQLEEDLSPIHVIGAHRTHLNLAIAKRIVDEHGGSFRIRNLPSNGLRVGISLPLDRRTLAREREM